MRESAKRRRRAIRIFMTKVCLVEICILLFLILVYHFVAGGKLYKKVIIQAGQEITVDLFAKKEKYKPEFVTDISQIKNNEPNKYEIELLLKGKKHTAKLEIVDTIKPTAVAAPQTVYNGMKVDPMTLVDQVQDNTFVMAKFKKDYDFTLLGDYDVVVVLTDLGGNELEVKTKVTVAKDDEPPIISGTKDIEVNLGDTITYKTGVTVTDNLDSNVELVIDNTAVDLKTPGTYPVTYSATDAAGNTATEYISVVVKEPEDGVYNEDIVYYLAGKVLNEIVNDSMSDAQKIKEVYTWTRTHIGYINVSDKSDWVKGAYQGLKERRGDCFIYFATAKAMLNVLGIDNIDIVKSDTSHSAHYWSLVNIGSGYYHYDCTPRKGGGEFYMLTDAELEAYSSTHNNSHVFDSSLYPERSTSKFVLE
ncbi:MAG: DUF5011 domain-containing protein [Lachnospiraceae bacterium]|nr:DUF5011 domain-containing protein [Lachnospiraceae bacterium]